MADAQLMDRAFQRIMRALVETGRAPHYAELGRALGLPAEAGRGGARRLGGCTAWRKVR